MTYFLLSGLALQCLAILSWGLSRRERMIQYPFLAAGVFLGWMMPQLLGLSESSALPAGALEKTIFMAILCLGAAYWGYTRNRSPAKLFWWQFDSKRLRIGATMLSLAGAFFFFQVSRLAAEVTAAHGGAWTGIVTIYVYFARLLSVGFVIALVLHLRRPSVMTWGVILFDVLFYLDRIIIQGRRAAMAELALIAVMALWFNRRWLPSRWGMIGAMIVGALVINSIGDYRSTMLGEDRTSWSGAGLSELLEIDFLGNLTNLANGTTESQDLRNAAFNIVAAERSFSFDYGLSHWNGFVNAFVPGQWVGREFKQSLMVVPDDLAYRELAHVAFTGSTPTGLSDAFQSFWYFGAVKFLLIGLIMSRWYRAANGGNLVAQMILMLVISDSLHAITHSTPRFFTVFIELAVFLLPALAFARIKSPKSYSTCRACSNLLPEGGGRLSK